MSLEKYIKEQKEQFEEAKMPEEATAVFEQQLRKSLHKKTFSLSNNWKYLAVAASLALLISVAYLYQPKEIKTEVIKREHILTAFDNETASERLQAIYDFEDTYKEEDTQFLKALFRILHNDASTNVKIAAIDAIIKFPENEEVRLALLSAMENEEEPLVQIKLIQSLSFLREERAKKLLKNIIEDRESFPEVKGNAALAMTKLEN